jgi:hypothetical protein
MLDMNSNIIKKLVKECINELLSFDSIHVPGYGMLSLDQCKLKIKQDLAVAIKAFKEEDYDTFNHILGRKGNGVLPEMITALRDYKNNQNMPPTSKV